MKQILTGISLLVMANSVYSAPVVYTGEVSHLAELASLGLATVSESFENDTVWAASRNSIGRPPSVTSKGIIKSPGFAI
jgi:hypothetical protein